MSARTYHGSCHCGAVRFRFVADPITTACRCNCSICVRKGAVMSTQYVPPADFVLEPGATLSCYWFGDRDVNHHFCTTCGVYPFHDTTAAPGAYRVNLGCVDDVDPLALQIKLLDGRSF